MESTAIETDEIVATDIPADEQPETDADEATEAEGTPADGDDFTGTATGADGADNTQLEGETFPQGDPEPVADDEADTDVPATSGPLGSTLDA